MSNKQEKAQIQIYFQFYVTPLTLFTSPSGLKTLFFIAIYCLCIRYTQYYSTSIYNTHAYTCIRLTNSMKTCMPSL